MQSKMRHRYTFASLRVPQKLRSVASGAWRQPSHNEPNPAVNQREAAKTAWTPAKRVTPRRPKGIAGCHGVQAGMNRFLGRKTSSEQE